ncbi:hypothetical protein CEN47_08230, partial [Fischerella thermalis CCMEE 5319]
IVAPSYYQFTALFKKKLLTNNNPEFIVSLTSFPSRIDKVWLTVESVLRQKEKPDKILLWLYSGEFNGKESLPKNLLQLEKRGLEIRFCNENLMPHKKYFYTMQEFPNANVITIDDDMFYPPDLIQKLKIFHEKFPKAIICPITQKIQIQNGKILPNIKWNYEKINSLPSKGYLTMGGGGTLFPKDSLPNDAFDISLIKGKALKADDLWLKIMSVKKHTKVVSIGGEYPRFFIPIIRKNDVRLTDSNIGEGQNDKIFKELLDYYKIPVEIFND